MVGTPVFMEFCAEIEKRGGEEYIFDLLRAGDSVSAICKREFGRSRDLLYKWREHGGEERKRKWEQARKDGAEGWLDKGAEVLEALPERGNLAPDVSAANSKASYYEKMGRLLDPGKFDKGTTAIGSVADLLLEALQHAGTAKAIKADVEPKQLMPAEIIDDDGEPQEETH